MTNQTDGRIDATEEFRSIDRWTDGSTKARWMDGQMDGQRDSCLDRPTDGWMDGWMDRHYL